MKNIVVSPGDKYRNFTIIREIDKQGIHRILKCICNCGKIKNIRLGILRTGYIKPCKCFILDKKITHGMSGTRIYRTYYSMLQRCNNKKNKSYKDYGGRGIKCHWNSFEEFYNDMKERYENHLTIDRIDNNGDYIKDNCRWITHAEQQLNKRNTIVRL